MMKRLFSVVLIIVSVFSFVGCGSSEDTNDLVTYEGVVSEVVYDNKEDAVNGFLTNEVVGEATNVRYEQMQVLEQVDIQSWEDINLGEEIALESVTSIEKVKVDYTDISSNVELAKEIFLIETNNGYYYLFNAVKEGEFITKSYLDHVMDFDYNSLTMVIEEEASVMGYSTTTYTELKVAQNGLVLTLDTGNGFAAVAQEVCTYFFLTDGKWQVIIDMGYETGLGRYMDQTGVYETMFEVFGIAFDSTISSMDLFKHYFTISYLWGLDHTYYNKVGNTIVLNEDKAQQEISKIIERILQSVGGLSGSNAFVENPQTKIALKDEKINKVEYSYSTNIFGNQTAVPIEGEITFKGYNSTSVDIPQGVIDYINA